MSKDNKDQRPLSKKKRGYLLAILGGVFGGPIGYIVSPLVLFGLNKTMKEIDGQKPNIFKRWALIGIFGAPLCLFPINFLEGDFQRKVDRCNDGRDEVCETLLKNYTSRLLTSKSDREKVTNPIFISNFEKLNAEERANACIENKGGENCLGIKTELIDADLLAKAQRYIDTQKIIDVANKAAEAKFKAEGWWEQKQGIFVRWCNNASSSYPQRGDCPRTDYYLDTVWRMMVWCRDKRCGNIYAKVNLSQTNDGPVMGWTNATAYGDYGQKVILTFQSSANVRVADLVEFSTY